MSTSTSRLSYGDCFDLLDRACADAKGMRVKFSTFAAAQAFRMRMYGARQIDREDNKQVYSKDHPMHGRSPYDVLRMTVQRASYERDTNGYVDDSSWLYFERTDTGDQFEAESLSKEQS